MDEFDDPVVRTALRERAARTVPPGDLETVLAGVRHRARRRRIRNGVATGALAAAAVVATAVSVGALTNERDVVRTPVTVPPDTTPLPETTTPVPSTTSGPPRK
jgi:hypothetical protein